MDNPRPKGFDRRLALDLLGGDEELLREAAQLFLRDAPRLLAMIQEATQANDAAGLQYAAHTLKGSVSNFAAEGAFQAALQLEKMGREGHLANAPDAYRALEQELDDLKSALASLSPARCE